MYDIGISAGTFNPIHLWHPIVADFARTQWKLKKVLFIPNGNPVHKKGVLDKEVRFEMVKAAIASSPFFEASRIEIDREGPSYTIDTLRALKAQYGSDVRLNLIIGVDNIEPEAGLPITRWKESEEVFSLCRLLIGPRHTVMTDRKKVAALLPAGTNFELIRCPSSSLSSTLVRDRIADGLSVRTLLSPAVFDIISSRRLYAYEPDEFEQDPNFTL